MQNKLTPSTKIAYRSIGKVRTKVSYLQMFRPGIQPLAPVAPLNTEIRKAQFSEVAFYRYLYDQVGSHWNWTGRKLLNDEQLLANITRASVEIFVLYYGGCPAGYIEIEEDAASNSIEIVYFGLAKAYFGKGLGGYLLKWAIASSWARLNISRIWLHTCDLDGKNALPTYVRAGFVEYKTETEDVDIIEPL